MSRSPVIYCNTAFCRTIVASFNSVWLPYSDLRGSERFSEAACSGRWGKLGAAKYFRCYRIFFLSLFLSRSLSLSVQWSEAISARESHRQFLVVCVGGARYRGPRETWPRWSVYIHNVFGSASGERKEEFAIQHITKNGDTVFSVALTKVKSGDDRVMLAKERDTLPDMDMMFELLQEARSNLSQQRVLMMGAHVLREWRTFI